VDALSITDDEDESEEDVGVYEKKGVLSKWTNYLHGWQDRYIVLKDGTLSYFKSENDLSFGCRGAVSLAKASVTVSVASVGIWLHASTNMSVVKVIFYSEPLEFIPCHFSE